jgi:hypothetical protein
MKYIFSLLLWLFTTFCPASYAHEHDMTPAEENVRIIDLAKKFYVEIDQIHFRDKKIYISADDIIYETPAVFSNENGY